MIMILLRIHGNNDLLNMLTLKKILKITLQIEYGISKSKLKNIIVKENDKNPYKVHQNNMGC